MTEAMTTQQQHKRINTASSRQQ